MAFLQVTLWRFYKSLYGVLINKSLRGVLINKSLYGVLINKSLYDVVIIVFMVFLLMNDDVD